MGAIPQAPAESDRGAQHAEDRDVPASSTRAPAFTINGRFLAQPVTGVQRYAREVIRAIDEQLEGRDHAVRLRAPHDAGDTLALRNIRFERLAPAKSHAWEQMTLPLRCRTPLLNLCNTAPLAGLNRVVCIHDANVFVAPDSYSKSFRVFYKTLQPAVARWATTVTTVSHDAAAKIARHINIPEDRIVIAPNGHEHALRWDADRSKLAETIALRRPYILLLGSLAKHKNIRRILELADVLDELGLDIRVVGSAAAIFQSERGAVAPNLAFLGAVSDDDLAFLLKNALCLAFPSLSEGFGIPLLEAMIWNCPIVASTQSSLPEVCGDAALFADPHDGAGWVKQFVALAESKTLSDELRAKGQEQARRFSWARSAHIYLDLMSRA
jgi:glycosyltransferase involved in cell wall biosynthesis